MTNAYALYVALRTEHQAHLQMLELKEAIQEAMHAFCQKGKRMRKQKAEHPAWIRDLTYEHDTGSGRSKRSDLKKEVILGKREEAPVISDAKVLKTKQKKAV